MSNRYYHQLHGVRGLAALAVLIFHWGAIFNVHPQLHEHGGMFSGWWFASFFIGFSWIGVMFFFVLSGVVLAAPYVDRQFSSITSFYIRRCLRIYPAVWLQILIFLLIGGIVSGVPVIEGGTVLLANIFLWINLPPTYVSPVNGVWWTLPVELGFYLLFPGVVFLCRKAGVFGLLILSGAVCLVWRASVFEWFSVESYAPYQVYLDALPSSLFYFCVGVAIAYLPESNSRLLRISLLIFSPLALFGLLLFLVSILDIYWSGHGFLWCWPIVSGLAIGGWIYALKVPMSGAHWLTSHLFNYLGDLSYGVYLWHFPLMMVIKLYLWREDFSLWMNVGVLILAIPGTLLIAWLSYRLVERPIIAWGKRRFSSPVPSSRLS